MTRREAGRQYGMTEGKLKQFEKMGLLPCVASPLEEPMYGDEEIALLGWIHSLQEMGMEVKTLCRYLTLRRSPADTRQEELYILRNQRIKLLDALHGQRETLERLDYLIHQTEKGGKKDEQKL